MYTHTLIVNLEGTDVEAELSFDGGQDVHLKFPDGTEVKAELLTCLSQVLNLIANEVQTCGELYKFEIIKK